MRSLDPDWYEALHTRPIRELTFGGKARAAVRAKAESLPVRKRRGLQSWPIAGFALLCALVILMLATESSLLQQGVLRSGETSLPAAADEWQTLIDARYAETDNDILYALRENDGSMLIFYRKVAELDGYRSVTLGVDRFASENGQWSFRQGSDYSAGIPGRAEDEAGLRVVNFRLGDTPFLIGEIFEPRISRIQAVDTEGSKQDAQIVAAGDGARYWLIVLPDRTNGFVRVEGLDEADRVVTERPFFRS